ncbi:MAG: hypothetical protein ACOYEW_13115 [Anaerolineae bacterium]|jgi:hypothetical protein
MDQDPGFNVIRELAYQVAALAAEPRWQELRRLWWEHNSLIKNRPMVLCRPVGAWRELIPPDSLISRQPLLRSIEQQLRMKLWKAQIGDDEVLEPWVVLEPVWTGPAGFYDIWGVSISTRRSDTVGGSFGFQPAINEEADFERLRVPEHGIDEARTALLQEQAQVALGDNLEVRLRLPRLTFVGLGYWASYLLGLEQLLYYMVERPRWVHRLMAFLRDAHIAYFRNAERDGLLSRNDLSSLNGVPRYCRDLPQPDFDGERVRLKDMWGEADSQEFGVVSPAMTEEFLYQYQSPVMSLFGVCSFGCCESHHGKWDLIRAMPNVRMVSVSPWTDLEEAVREMGDDYALNWRVSPSRIQANLDPDDMRAEIEEGLAVAGHTCLNIVYQDIETVKGSPEHLRVWTTIAKEAACRYS